jgi:hypothetical protein
MKNNLIYNPIAKQIFEAESAKRLFENEKVNDLIKKISNNALDTFKVLIFDIASRRERDPDFIREILKDISDSKTVKQITAKMKDYGAEADVSSSGFAETKTLYLKALRKFCDALDRINEISGEKGKKIVEFFQSRPESLQMIVDKIAEEIKKKEESLNESLGIGYGKRINDLKKSLVNLISSAEGKDAKNGYSKDWKRIFIELDQKLQTLDTSKGGIGEKDRKYLESLEKDVEKNAAAFRQSLIQAADRAIKSIEEDDEVIKSYSDVTTLSSEALDDLARAKTEYELALKKSKENAEEKEITAVKEIFPIKSGDKDTDKKFKDSDLIQKIQKALMNGIPSAKEILDKKGGSDGIYGPATKSIIQAIQKQAGNKNINGELDKALLDSIVISDFVDKKDKQDILDSLSTIAKELHESLRFLNEEKLTINSDQLKSDFSIFYKETTGKDTDDSSSAKTDRSSEKSSSSAYNVDSLAKKLRTKFGLKTESDTFLREDGSLKPGFPADFLDVWEKTIDNIPEGELKDYGFFFYKDGIYNFKSNFGVKDPNNFPKWKSIDSSSESVDNLARFSYNYSRSFPFLGGIKLSSRLKTMKEFFPAVDAAYSQSSSTAGELDLQKTYDIMEFLLKPLAGQERYAAVPFIPIDNLNSKVSRAIDSCLSDDLGDENFVNLNNIVCLIGSTFTFMDGKFVPTMKWLYEEHLTPKVMNRIVEDKIYGNQAYSLPKLYFKDNTLALVTTGPVSASGAATISKYKKPNSDFKWTGMSDRFVSGSDENNASLFFKNLIYASSYCYPILKTHCERMNASKFSEVPQIAPAKCYNPEK